MDQVGMVLLVPGVKLKDERTPRQQTIVKVIVIAAHQFGRAFGSKQLGIPATAPAASRTAIKGCALTLLFGSLAVSPSQAIAAALTARSPVPSPGEEA